MCTHIDDLYAVYIRVTNTVSNISEIEAKNRKTQYNSGASRRTVVLSITQEQVVILSITQEQVRSKSSYTQYNSGASRRTVVLSITQEQVVEHSSKSVLLFCTVAVCCSVLQCVAVCCSVLQCVAVCCSVLQCVAVRAVRCEELLLCHTRQRICWTRMTHAFVVSTFSRSFLQKRPIILRGLLYIWRMRYNVLMCYMMMR